MSIIGDALKSLGNLFVKKSGDTMSGNLILTSSNDIQARCSEIHIGSTPSSDIYYAPYKIRDADGNEIGAVYGTYGRSGSLGTQLETARYINGTRVVNNLRLMVAENGARQVTVTESAPWRKALDLSSLSASAGSQYLKVIARYPASGSTTIRNGHTSISVTIPSGYKVLMAGNVQSNGFVAYGAYVLTDVIGLSGTFTIGVWMHPTASDGTANGYITVPLLCIRSE